MISLDFNARDQCSQRGAINPDPLVTGFSPGNGRLRDAFGELRRSLVRCRAQKPGTLIQAGLFGPLRASQAGRHSVCWVAHESGGLKSLARMRGAVSKGRGKNTSHSSSRTGRQSLARSEQRIPTVSSTPHLAAASNIDFLKQLKAAGLTMPIGSLCIDSIAHLLKSVEGPIPRRPPHSIFTTADIAIDRSAMLTSF